MNANRRLLLTAFAILACISTACSPGGPEVTVRGDEVLVATGDLDLRFKKGRDFEDTYMVFGGGHIEHPNAVAPVSIAGLSLREARPIYRRYPDFHRCASPGASLAKDRITHLQVVPADGETLEGLLDSLDEFEESLSSNGDRVCVRVRGSRLQLESAEVREVGENITDQVPQTAYHLIDSTSRVECRQVLGDG